MSKTLLYLVPNDSYFLSHRLPMVRAAVEAGFTPVLVTGSDGARAAIEAQGVRVILCPFLTPGGLNPWREARAATELVWIYRAERPHIAHHITFKAILYGALAAWLAGTPHVVNAFAGLGYIFVSEAPLARTLRVLLFPWLGLLLRRGGSIALFQNPDDRATLEQRGLTRAQDSRVIPGSGIDPGLWPLQPLPGLEKGVICLYAGRMIGIKGLETLKAAFVLLQSSMPEVSLWLCGAPDPANPGSWSADDLRAWERGAANVRWLGPQKDMAAIWAGAHIALQPSDGGEGIPKALLEAACTGRPIVASDVPGCREVVEHGRNGLLVPPRDPASLAAAIAVLARDPQRLRVFAALSRRLVEERALTAESVTARTRALYESMKG